MNAPFWTSSILLLAQLLSIWSISLIVSTSQRQNRAAAQNVELINKLNQLESSVQELEGGLSPEANWNQIGAKYRAAAGALMNDPYAAGEVGTYVMRCDTPVSRMGLIRSEVLRLPAASPQAEDLRTEFLRDKRQLLEQVENARRTARGRFSLVTEGVENNWSYLKVLVAAACLLALGVANLFRQNRIHEANRQRAGQALRESDERYRQLFENVNDIVFALDLDGNFISINSAFERVTGFGREEALRMSVANAVAPEDAGRARAMVQGSLQSEGSGAEDFTLMTKHGGRRIVEVSTRPLLVDGKPAAVHGIARDITDRRELEDRLRQAQKMEAIGQLAGGVAHDFNNLLMVINGYSNMALEELKPEDPAWTNIEEVKKAGERATQLTRQLLAFSRKQVLQPQVLDLNETIESMEKLLRRLLGENIVLHRECEPELGCVKADPGQLEQVIMNLAINARDAMRESGTLTLRTRSDGPFAVLEVSDTGCGMTPEMQKHLFEPFFTTKAQGQGTGLGLSMVYGIVKQSAGEIEIASEAGNGTTFRILLPRTRMEKGMGAQECPVIPTKGSETVLVAEDEEPLRALLVAVLKKLGYRVLEAPNGASALKIAQEWEHPIHLLLTDVVMPEMGGLELAERLSATRPSTRVLYLSGYTNASAAELERRRENFTLLQKPVTPDLLARNVREVLDRGATELAVRAG